MLRVLSRLFALAVFAGASAFAQVGITAGKDYIVLSPAQPTDTEGQAEVLEFFAYGCIHCFHLEPQFDTWAKRQPKEVKVKRVPVDFKINGFDSRPIFYTLEAMGQLEKLHYKIFEAIHKDNLKFGNPDVLAQWLVKQGVDIKRYREVEQSFSVDSKIKRARNLQTNFKIDSTPTLAVNGKYVVGANPERMFVVTEALIAMPRQGEKAKS